jgi:hypothetical protein
MMFTLHIMVHARQRPEVDMTDASSSAASRRWRFIFVALALVFRRRRRKRERDAVEERDSALFSPVRCVRRQISIVAGKNGRGTATADDTPWRTRFGGSANGGREACARRWARPDSWEQRDEGESRARSLLHCRPLLLQRSSQKDLAAVRPSRRGGVLHLPYSPTGDHRTLGRAGSRVPHTVTLSRSPIRLTSGSLFLAAASVATTSAT